MQHNFYCSYDLTTKLMVCRYDKISTFVDSLGFRLYIKTMGREQQNISIIIAYQETHLYYDVGIDVFLIIL